MVKDKNGTEIKIGDTVHYKRPETLSEWRYEITSGYDRPKTVTRPAKDIIFTVDEFVDSPFVRHGGYDPRLNENRIWVTGPELGSSGFNIASYGSRNAVSPLAVVKVDTFVKKVMPTFSLV